MENNNPQNLLNLREIQKNHSYDDMVAKYIFNLSDKTKIIGEGSFGKVHIFKNKNDS
jgi:hypothetical protein